MIEKKVLGELYLLKGHSMLEIARLLKVSTGQISYWMDRYGLQRRTISEAVYAKNNPDGDPFRFKSTLDDYEKFLLGLGLGLFWGEGMKTSTTGVRLGNTDPQIILYFRDFLEIICGVPAEKIKYSLQIFGDISPHEAVKFWAQCLSLEEEKLGTPSIVKLVRKGTYKKKNKYGVLQIACHNKKLKIIIDTFIDLLKQRRYADVAQLVEHVHGRAHDAPAQSDGNV